MTYTWFSAQDRWITARPLGVLWPPSRGSFVSEGHPKPQCEGACAPSHFPWLVSRPDVPIAPGRFARTALASLVNPFLLRLRLACHPTNSGHPIIAVAKAGRRSRMPIQAVDHLQHYGPAGLTTLEAQTGGRESLTRKEFVHFCLGDGQDVHR